MRSLVIGIISLCALAALADRRGDALVRVLDWTFDQGGHDKSNPPLVLLDNDRTVTEFDETPPYPQPGLSLSPMHPVFGYASDGGAGWMSGDLMEVFACGMEGCDKIVRDNQRKAEREPPFHMTALVEGTRPLFIHVGQTGKGVGHGTAMTAQIDDAAKPVVELFEKTIGDPKALAATVSARKETMMYGTEPNERFVGAETVRATLAKWGLAFKVTGGIRAGTTKSKTIAWVLADVDTVAKAGKKPVPYRVSAIYEKSGADWKLVQLHFS